MRKLSEKSRQPEKRSLGAVDIQATCIPIFLRYTNVQADCTEVRVRLRRCRFSPCQETMSPIPSPTSPATSPKDRSTSIEDCTGKESIHPSTLRPLSPD